MAEHVTDEQIRVMIGLNETEVRELQFKFSQLVKTLDEPQKETLKSSIPSAKAAAATLGPGVNPERLMEFIRARAPQDAPMLMIFNGVSKGHGHPHGH